MRPWRKHRVRKELGVILQRPVPSRGGSRRPRRGRSSRLSAAGRTQPFEGRFPSAHHSRPLVPHMPTADPCRSNEGDVGLVALPGGRDIPGRERKRERQTLGIIHCAPADDDGGCEILKYDLAPHTVPTRYYSQSQLLREVSWHRVRMRSQMCAAFRLAQ